MLFVVFAGLLAATLAMAAALSNPGKIENNQGTATMEKTSNVSDLRDIYFAGGCFWGVEEYFSRIPGVRNVTVGYANGEKDSPTYKEVCSGRTGHAETVHVTYAPNKVSLRTLTQQFFKIIDPTSINRQGNDRGTQYRTGIYYVDEADKPVLQDVMDTVQKQYTEPHPVEPRHLGNYRLAEEYHQDYLKKNPNGYCHINFDSLSDLPSREAGIPEDLYKMPPKEDLKAKLNPMALAVTQNAATEPPFTGQYWNHYAKGIYVDIVTGEPLFASTDKFESGCGWPSFSKPIDPSVVQEQRDTSHGMERVEVKSRIGHSHLGHVFDDGPKDLGGLRYCINSAALRFVAYDNMDAEGYGYLKHLVQ